ncbi:hypothetical protein P3W45_000913 [Vairimorpha bombi]
MNVTDLFILIAFKTDASRYIWKAVKYLCTDNFNRKLIKSRKLRGSEFEQYLKNIPFDRWISSSFPRSRYGKNACVGLHMIVCANIDYHKIRASRNSPDFEIVNKKLGPCTCRFPQEFGYTFDINVLESNIRESVPYIGGRYRAVRIQSITKNVNRSRCHNVRTCPQVEPTTK